MPEKNGKGRIVVATGGTSDIPVAEKQPGQQKYMAMKL